MRHLLTVRDLALCPEQVWIEWSVAPDLSDIEFEDAALDGDDEIEKPSMIRYVRDDIAPEMAATLLAQEERLRAADTLAEALMMALDLEQHELIDFGDYGLTCDADISKRYQAALATYHATKEVG